jgi:rhodanese-related sulfurtransferase
MCTPSASHERQQGEATMNTNHGRMADRLIGACAAALLCIAGMGATLAADKPAADKPANVKAAASIPAERLIQPAQLALLLGAGNAAKPLVLQVGFRKLYDQAHITGSEYAGPGNSAAGLQLLRERVAGLPKDASIVIYCGCCPWARCPNVAAAYETLLGLGFTAVSVMYVADNFGADWVDKGYPTTTAQ